MLDLHDIKWIHRDDSEISLARLNIVLLEAECGYLFTSKLEGMFNDMQISKETTEKYRSHEKSLNIATTETSTDPRDNENRGKSVDVKVSVLTTGYWPRVKMFLLASPLLWSKRRWIGSKSTISTHILAESCHSRLLLGLQKFVQHFLPSKVPGSIVVMVSILWDSNKKRNMRKTTCKH